MRIAAGVLGILGGLLAMVVGAGLLVSGQDLWPYGPAPLPPWLILLALPAGLLGTVAGCTALRWPAFSGGLLLVAAGLVALACMAAGLPAFVVGFVPFVLLLLAGVFGLLAHAPARHVP